MFGLGQQEEGVGVLALLSFNDWEMEEMEGLPLHLCGQKLTLEEEDRVQWMETKDGTFSTKSLYKALEPDSSVLFPMKNIRKSCVQPKCLGCSCLRLGKPYWVGIASLWEKSAKQFQQRVLFAFFGQFGKLGIELPLKMRCCPSKG
ncbi:hypothetical protein CK203_023406 [Vitis vinifera]|uniref:Uncharacterized protein n=1 Tax=Vitis vinifera TaxID=29760 RepID=A0A438J6G9_VITVI|nr:hypothetical protein CK203_023406 [Vitis vinifera]